MHQAASSHRRSRLFALVLIVAGCGHSDSFQTPAQSNLDVPLSSTPPARLTFDGGMDRFPAFTPDRQTIWYSFQSPDRADGDRCLASLPATGGTRTEYCPPTVASEQRRDAFDHASPGPDGQLIYGRYDSPIGALLVSAGSIELASVTAPLQGRQLLSLPNSVGGVGFNHVGRIRWLANDRVILVAEDQTAVPHCRGCVKRDTVNLGGGLLDGRITANGATFTLIPGTLNANDFASSVAGDSLYFTQSDDLLAPTGRDRALYRVPITGGSPQVVYADSGTPLSSVARIGVRLAVAAGNSIISLDLASGNSTTLASGATNGYGLVSASADGCRLLAEFRRPKELTFTTDLYLLLTGGTGCAP